MLPTASTLGYTYYYTYGYAPNVACVCLKQWLDTFRKLCVHRGFGDPVVWQCTGADSSSANTHSQGGVFDLAGIGDARAMLAREMGAVAWPRNWPGNQHTHGVIDCPHNSPARYQRTACILFRRDGLGYLGLAHPDPLPKPTKWRTWTEGIAWAKAQLGTNPAPTPQTFMEKIMALSTSDQNEFNGAIATALVYALRNAPSVRAEIAKIVDETVLGVWQYKNADLTQRDAYAWLRGQGDK